ncbi:CueP family metal-binding protein [Demequina activiva]|uniref:CueP family metal-binding protein n=1 Tax=Demequina activiva TaxID=1582364 RepID=A0A919Q2R2_9MICO|nr:CueP family metal-binding protein [Demequina activiva]GIG55162.1 hypothetical protein Dac01nite_19140 [Demequina activiva]
MLHTRTQARIRVAAASAALALLLAACTAAPAQEAPVSESSSPEAPSPEAPQPSADEILGAYGLAGLDAREVIDTLDATALAERESELFASIRPDELLISDASGAEVALPMPEDEFYVSIAPYVDTTHECYFHSLTTCAGEMRSEAVDVLVTDAASGEVLLEQSMVTFDNGFVGLWLPRGTEVDLTITRDGLTATERLSTDDGEDATCVTTMQLA